MDDAQALDDLEAKFYDNLPQHYRDIYPRDAASVLLYVAMMTTVAEGVLVRPGVDAETAKKQQDYAASYLAFTKVVVEGNISDLGT